MTTVPLFVSLDDQLAFALLVARRELVPSDADMVARLADRDRRPEAEDQLVASWVRFGLESTRALCDQKERMGRLVEGLRSLLWALDDADELDRADAIAYARGLVDWADDGFDQDADPDQIGGAP